MFQKLVAPSVTPVRSTPDKFECANDAPDKSAPAKLLFLIFVRSVDTKIACERFVFSRLVSTKLAYVKSE